MKNYYLLILLFVANFGFSQSDYSFNLVTKVGITQWNNTEALRTNEAPLSSGKSYSFGIEANKYLNKSKSLSLRYGFLNQLNLFSGQTNSQVDYGIEIYDGTYNTELKSFEILLPVKLQSHLGNWSVFGGIIPTYHFKTNINQSSVLVPTIISGDNIEYESNFDICNPLYHKCFTGGKLPFLRNFDFQYTLGIQYQLKRFSFFAELTDYIWANPINPYNNPGSAVIDVVGFAAFSGYGTFGRSVSFGTAFSIF